MNVLNKNIICKKINHFIVKLIIMFLISLIIFMMFIFGNNDMGQYLDNLEYNVVVLENGDMRVTEIWDIYIKNTNTLFKNFDIDKSKYSGISDVKVSQIIDNNKIELTQIDNEMYHVTKDCYYALNINNDTQFEIAWGVGLDNTHDLRKYEISYTVNDVINQYNDCQELYWQFLELGKNTIFANKVIGNVTLPYGVSNIEKLRVWGHGATNGYIERVDNNKVRFIVNGLNFGERLEIRIVNLEDIYDLKNENKINDYNMLENILAEEKKWETYIDNDSLIFIHLKKIVYIIIFIIFMVLLICIIKYTIIRKKLRRSKKINIQYYREIPRENISTPSEALYLYNFNKERLNTKKIEKNAVAATILDLCLKKKIQLRIEKTKDIYIKVLGTSEGLNKQEKEIYDLLKSINKDEFEISKLNHFANEYYYIYSRHINNFVNETRKSLYQQKLINKSKEYLYNKCSKVRGNNKNSILYTYEWFIFNNLFLEIPIVKMNILSVIPFNFITNMLIILLAVIPLILENIYLCNIKIRISENISVLTDEGQKEKAQWKGLYRYLVDYSLIKEKKVTDLVLWEKYLVYATAFGISDVVIKQLKSEYPFVFVKESWEENSELSSYPVLKYITSFDINNSHDLNIDAINRISNSFDIAYNKAQNKMDRYFSSSGNSSGSRWRIFRRRRRPAGGGGRNGRQID